MNGYERTVAFVNGNDFDRPPFMPLIIEWVSKQKGISYPDFVYKPEVRAQAYLEICDEYDVDCILPDTDFFEQLEDFGKVPTWTEAGFQAPPIINDLADIDKLEIPEIKPGTRQGNRIEIIERVVEKAKGNKYIFGICIGPFTEYCNARGLTKAVKDMKKNLDELKRGLDIFYENCMNFIKAQMAAGADGIQIVEPNCSLISPLFYKEHIMPLHTKMVEEIQKDGGFCRLHICGETSKVMPYTLGTGTRILDVDSQVDLAAVEGLLADNQRFCGNLNTSEEVLFGKPEEYENYVNKRIRDTHNRIIIAAGCDVPADTPAENMRAWHDAVAKAK